MRIAFHLGAEIYVVGGAGGTPLNLTKHNATDAHPTWSPDGSRIAFASDRGGAWELYVMRADGSGVTRLTSGVGVAGNPDWSADGSRIAFDCVIDPGNADVCSVKADGSGFVRLTNAPESDAGPDWSPSGRIAFATARYGAGVEIATMNGDGSSVQRVAAGITGVDPDWSPDGTRLAFTRGEGIYAMNADGTNLALVVAGGSAPAWRPTSSTYPSQPPPVARLGTPTCVELTCTFDGSTSTDDAGTTALEYWWSFGDGTSGQGTATPKHSFPAAGAYTATLTVTTTMAANNGQASATQTVNVTGLPVGAPPLAYFVVNCSAGLTCDLDGRGSSDDAAVMRWSWITDQSTGATATGPVVTVPYPLSGTRTAVLTVTDAAGQTNSISHSYGATPPPGDAPPVARLRVVCDYTLCNYDGTASSDDNLILSYFLDIGIPGAALLRQSSAMISYAPGTYTLTLIVMDNVGQTNSTSQTVTVSAAPPPDQPPTANFTYSCVRTSCTFDGRASTDDKGITSYAWRLGGPFNASATGAVVTYDYKRAGSYTVTLTVRDVSGQTGSVTRTIAVVR
jgi:PKD repeat protein